MPNLEMSLHLFTLAPILLGTLVPQGGNAREMLAKLEKGPGFPARLEAARFFAGRSESPGVDVLEALLAETRLQEVQKAILVAVGEKRGVRTSKLFREGMARLPALRQLEVLRLLGGVHTPHVAVFRLRARKDGYIPLAVEALRQDAARGDNGAAKALRALGKKRGLPGGVAGSILAALIPVARPGDLALFANLLERGGLRAELAWDEGLAALRARPGILIAARQLLGAKSATFRSIALRILASEAAVLSELKKALRDPSPKLRRVALRILVERKDPSALPVLLEQARRATLSDRLDALESLAAYGDRDPGLRRTFAALLHDLALKGPVPVRVFALDLAARQRLASFGALIPNLLRASDWRLRIAACRLARGLRQKASLPALIKALAKAKGREREELTSALHSLTRLFFLRPEGWKHWWAKAGANFELPPPPERGQDAGSSDATSARFYGLPVNSLRVCFVLDVSGSMRQASGTGQTRMQVARRELAGVLSKLPGEAKVNLIFFDSEVHPFAKHLVPLGKRGVRKKLLDFIREATPLGATNLSDALALAFADRETDSLYILSDGEPTTGAVKDPVRLKREVARWNRGRLLRLHCVSIGRDSPLLAALARHSGGRYVRK